jgi:hypothetical protein
MRLNSGETNTNAVRESPHARFRASAEARGPAASSCTAAPKPGFQTRPTA